MFGADTSQLAEGAFISDKSINVSSLENGKYHLLDEDSYEKYYFLLSELCDTE